MAELEAEEAAPLLLPLVLLCLEAGVAVPLAALARRSAPGTTTGLAGMYRSTFSSVAVRLSSACAGAAAAAAIVVVVVAAEETRDD